MSDRVSNIMKSTFVKDVAKLLSANVVAQAAGLLVYPLLTRMYTPEEFGLLYIFTSIGGVLVLLGTAGYQFAIPLPKDDRDGAACFHAGLLCLAPLMALLLLLLPFSGTIAGWFGSAELANWLPFMPLYVGLLCLWNLLNWWYTRCRQFGSVSRYQASNSLLNAALKLLLGWWKVPHGLMAATVSVPPLSVGLNILAARKHLSGLSVIDGGRCKRMLAAYRKFPMFTMPQSLINHFFGNLPAYLLAPQFGQSALGLWSMALLLSFTPINTVCNSLYQVLFADVSKRVNNREQIRHLFVRLEKWALGITLPLFTVLYFVLPPLTGWILGAEWTEAGRYIRWFLPWLTVTMLTSSTSFVPDIFFKQHAALGFEILLAVLRTGGIVAGMMCNDFMLAVACYGISSALVKMANYIWMRSLVNGYEKSLAQGQS